MHLARKKKPHYYSLQYFELKKSMAGVEGVYLNELKYIINAIVIVQQFETDLDNITKTVTSRII